MTQEPGQPAQPPQPGQPSQPGQWGQPPQPPQLGQWGQPQWGQSAWPQQQGWPQTGYPGYQQYVPPPKPGVIPLRPLTLGEVLDGAFQAARRNARAMFGSALLVQAASAVVNLALLAVLFGTGLSLTSIASGNVTSSEVGAFVVGAGAAALIAGLLQTLTTMVLQGVLVIPVSRAVLDRGTGFRQMWSLARRRIWALLGLALLYVAAVLIVLASLALVAWGLISALGGGGAALTALLLLAVVVVLVWIGTKLLLAPASLVVENLGVFRAIGRSWNLTTGHWWRTFGTALLARVIVATITGIIAAPVAFLANLVSALINPHPTVEQEFTQVLVVQAISLVLSGLLGAVALAFESGVLALIYVDLRMRKEGFDVVLMKEHEGGPDSDPNGIPGQPRLPAPPGIPGAREVSGAPGTNGLPPAPGAPPAASPWSTAGP